MEAQRERLPLTHAARTEQSMSFRVWESETQEKREVAKLSRENERLREFRADIWLDTDVLCGLSDHENENVDHGRLSFFRKRRKMTGPTPFVKISPSWSEVAILTS